MGFSITTSNGVLSRDLPPSHPTVQTWPVLASVICPKTAFTFDVLDHFYMMPWNARLPVEISKS